MGYVKRQIVFNEENRQQRELYEWIIAHGGGENFSGFVRTVLFAYMSGGANEGSHQVVAKTYVAARVDDDSLAMNDIF